MSVIDSGSADCDIPQHLVADNLAKLSEWVNSSDDPPMFFFLFHSYLVLNVLASAALAAALCS